MTPSTTLKSGLFAGAVMTTFLAPAARCFAAASRLVNRPVDSNTTSTPRSFHGSWAGIADRQHLELVAVDRDAVGLGLDLRVQVAEHRVVLQQMRKRVRAREVVDGDKVDVLVAERGAHDVAADAAEAVDTYPDRHAKSSGTNVSFYNKCTAMYLAYSLLTLVLVRRRVAVLPLPGDPLQEVHRHPAAAARVPADHLQRRRRRVDLDPRRLGRRGADRARAGRRSEGALPAPAPVPLDDDDRRAARGAPQPRRRRRRLLLPVRLDVHRPAHAASRAAAALHHDGDRDLAEPAARMPRAAACGR